MKNLSIQIASVPHREKLIAEILCDNYVIAELNQDSDDVLIEVFSYSDFPLEITVDQFIEAVKRAKYSLIGK